MTINTENVQAGIDYLQASEFGDGYAYYAAEVDAWHPVDSDQLGALGAALAQADTVRSAPGYCADETNGEYTLGYVYSDWCNGVGSSEPLTEAETAEMGANA